MVREKLMDSVYRVSGKPEVRGPQLLTYGRINQKAWQAFYGSLGPETHPWANGSQPHALLVIHQHLQLALDRRRALSQLTVALPPALHTLRAHLPVYDVYGTKDTNSSRLICSQRLFSHTTEDRLHRPSLSDEPSNISPHTPYRSNVYSLSKWVNRRTGTPTTIPTSQSIGSCHAIALPRSEGDPHVTKLPLSEIGTTQHSAIKIPWAAKQFVLVLTFQPATTTSGLFHRSAHQYARP